MTVVAKYNARVKSGAIKKDQQQIRLARKLDTLMDDIQTFERWHKTRAHPLKRWLKRHAITPPTATQGLYIHGDVGRGKSFLMDLFFENAPTQKKRRVHFHAFMQEIHAKMNHMRKLKKRSDSLLPSIARKMVGRHFLLCFDEFQVTNIADAMILGRLFEAMFHEGVMIVTTSNCAPDALYKDGLQRNRFEPFIKTLTRKTESFSLDGTCDYRLQHLQQLNHSYHTPLGKKADDFITKAFGELTAGSAPKPDKIRVGSRILPIPKSSGDVAWFSFAELCEQPLGAADYLALAQCYTTIILQDVPRFTPEKRNEATRFTALIDALYEHHTKLIISAAAAPDMLSTGGDHNFAFARTASRLFEMQSQDYWHSPHITN